MRRHIILTVGIALSSSVASAPSDAQTHAGGIAPACERVVQTFLELDGEGAQLTAAGQQKVASLFTQRGAPSTDRVSVVSDDVVVGPIEHAPNSRMRVMLEYIYLGALTLVDTSYDNKPGGIKSRNSFVLSVVEGAPASPVCQIEGTPPPPQLTLSAAIRHVTALRDSARDAVERRRLTRALNGLERERSTRRRR
jgi:hypothetical protein